MEPLLDHIIILDQSHILLDASVDDITSRYAFRNVSPEGAQSTDVLYTEPGPMGLAAIVRRRDGEAETQVNLELLFDYVELSHGAIR